MIQAIGAAFGVIPSYVYTGGEIRPYYLTARPGFWGGLGGIIDVFSPLQWNYTSYYAPGSGDEIPLYADWSAVGQDLRRAVEHHSP